MKDPITVSVSVTIDIDRAWEIWVNPDHITQWCSGDESWETTTASNDLKVGGKFLTHMQAKDRSSEFDFTGEYTLVNHHKAIHYTIEDGRKVGVSFEVSDDQVLVTEVFEPESINARDLQVAGWQHILDNFKQYAENNK